MRIGMVTHYGLPHIGGIETAVAGLADALRRRGHDVRHLSSAIGGANTDPTMQRVSAWGGMERLGVPYPLFGPSLSRALDSMWEWADVVHCHGLLYQPTLRSARRRTRRRSSPGLVITEHVGHVPYKSRLLDLLERVAISTLGRRSARSADALAAVNERVATEMRRLVPGRQIEVIGNGVDVESFFPLSESDRRAGRAELGWDRRPRVLFVGRLVEKKGVSMVVEVARRLGADAEVLVVGPGRPPGGPVRALGPLARERVAVLMRHSDALLLPSHGEGFPVVVQEALASGLPCVVAEDPTYAEVERRSRGGLRTADGADGSVAALRGALRQGVSAREDARHLAVSLFSWTPVCERYESLYLVAAERAGRSGPAGHDGVVRG